MYDIVYKIYKCYKTQNNLPSKNIIVKPINAKNETNHYNDKIKKYANKSLKKSIKKIEDECREPDYKIKTLAVKIFNDDYDSNCKKIFKIIAGTTTISFSLYLVYSFMKRYRT